MHNKLHSDYKLTAGVLVEYPLRENRIIAVRQQNETKWGLPAGHPEKFETLPKTALREGQEETGTRLRLNGFLGVAHYQNSKDITVALHIFTASLVNGEPNISRPNEIREINYFNLRELKHLAKKNLLKGKYALIQQVERYFERAQLIPLDCFSEYFQKNMR